MPWIKYDTSLHNKPRVQRIAETLEISRFDAAGRLCAVWGWADTMTDDGRIAFGTLSQIDRAAEIEGFGQAMLDVGWVELDGDDLVIPDWEAHHSASAKRRADGAKRAAKNRQTKADSGKSQTRVRKPRTKSAPRGEEKREEESNTPLTPQGGSDQTERENHQTTEGNQTKPIDPARAAQHAKTAADLERGIPAAEFDPTMSSAMWHRSRANGVAPAPMPAKIPSGYGDLTGIEAGRTILDEAGWPEVRRQGNLGATRLGELAFVLLRQGDEDPVATIGQRMIDRVELERKSKDGELGFLPKVTNWIEEEFCDVLAKAVSA